MKAKIMCKTVLMLMTCFTPLLNFAADNYFTGTGDWTDTARWSLAHIPTEDEVAWIQGTAAVDSSQTIGGMNIQGTLDITGVSSIFSTTGQVQIGYSGSDGILTQTGGSFNVSSNFYVGEYRTGYVEFNNTDVTLGKFVVGHNSNGVGTDVHNGGSLLLNGSHAVLASGTPTTRGIMSITDVALTSTPDFVVGYVDGKFYSTNSTINCSLHFSVANQPNSKGYAELINSAIVDCNIFRLGNYENAEGYLIADGSNITSDYVRIGSEAGGIGTLFLTNTVMKTATEFTAGYYGFGTISNFGGKIESPKIYLGQLAGSCGNLYVQNGEAVDVPQIYIGNEANATGSLTLASGTLEANSMISCGYNGVGCISNVASVIKTYQLYVSHNTDTAKGYMYCGPVSTTAVDYVMQVGRYGTGVTDCYGSMAVNGSAVGLYIGNLANSFGTFNHYAGANLYVTNQMVLGYTRGCGTFNQYGGDVKVRSVIRIGGVNGTYTDAQGFYNLYDGTLWAGNTIYVGNNGTGVLHVAGGFLKTDVKLYLSTAAGSYGTCLLTGGCMEVPYVSAGTSGWSEFFFDGGILAASINNSSFMSNIDKIEVRSGGAKFDSKGKDITISQSIDHDSRGGEPAKDGGLTKIGEGTLSMTGILGFTGDLGADGGTLDLSTATYSLASGSGLWGSGTLVPPAGGISVSSTGFVAPGSTNGVGTLTVDGSLTVDGEIRITISSDSTTCGSLNMESNDLTFMAGSTLVIENPEALDRTTSYTIVTGSNISGTPDVTGLPDNWQLSTSRSNQLRVIYNSGTVILIK